MNDKFHAETLKEVLDRKEPNAISIFDENGHWLFSFSSDNYNAYEIVKKKIMRMTVVDHRENADTGELEVKIATDISEFLEV
jgi:hypothetical protein